MKKALIVLSVLLVSLAAQGQKQDEEFKTLQLNSSPAYVILGVEPDNIQRPNSPSDFMANAQSAIVNEKLQPNFAMETSPYYWRKKRPEDTTRTYSALYFVANQNYWENFARSVTLSFATSPSDSFTFGSIPLGTGIGFGFHLQLVHGKVSSKTRDNLLAIFYQQRMTDVISELETELNNADIDDLDIALENFYATTNDKSLSEEKWEIIKQLVKQKIRKKSLKKTDMPFITRLRAANDIRANEIAGHLNANKLPLTREGFMLELAFADAAIAEQSRWDHITNAKASIWLTPSYRFNVNKDPRVIDFVDLMAVARITLNAPYVDSSNYFDAGLKLQWSHNNISLSGESIFRLLTQRPESQEKKYTWRNDISISYKISEAITFKATFGSNFDGTSTHYADPKKMFAVGGFCFGFSNFLKKAN